MPANLDRGNAMSRHRVGLALPVGIRGRKSQWSAKVSSTAQRIRIGHRYHLKETGDRARERLLRSETKTA
jgi:hypothetical protein